jgi:hypothetical protein
MLSVLSRVKLCVFCFCVVATRSVGRMECGALTVQFTAGARHRVRACKAEPGAHVMHGVV